MRNFSDLILSVYILIYVIFAVFSSELTFGIAQQSKIDYCEFEVEFLKVCSAVI